MKEDDHHYIEGVGYLPRVTSILSIIRKPALEYWQAKHGAAKALKIMEALKDLAPSAHEALQQKFGVHFFKNGTALAEEAANYGKSAHSYIDQYLKSQAIDPGVFKDEPEPVQNAVAAFLEWQAKIKPRVIKSESRIYSLKLRYSGTLDAICDTVEGVTLFDWKTTGGIYREHTIQAIAYKYAAEELSGERIPKVMICRFGKDGSFEPYEIPEWDHADLFEDFLCAKRLWEGQRAWEERKNKAA